MPFTENTSYFFDGPVQDYRGPADWRGPEVSYRLRADGSVDARDIVERLDALVQHTDASRLRAIVFGRWGGTGNGSSAAIVERLVRHRERLAGLAAIFLGDITQKELETTWIQHADVGPLLLAYPNLEVLRIRGSQGLRLATSNPHENLRALIVESSGMQRSFIADLCRCQLPGLVHLELWLGAKNSGWDCDLDDLQSIAEGALFPRLKYLGLRNSEFADNVAAWIVNKPLLQQLDTLDLSDGNLTDRGGRALWGIMWDVPLRQLILNHNYMSPKIIRTLQMELRCKVVAGGSRTPVEGRLSIFAGD